MPQPLSRQQRRVLERQQRKRTRGVTADPAAPLALLGSAMARAIASAVPTHSAGCPLVRRGVQVAWSERRIGNRDTAAWHECGHATAFLALGWHVWSVEVVPIVPAPHPDAWTGLCRGESPTQTDPRAFRAHHRASAVIAVAGPMAERTVLAGLGVVAKRPEDYAVIGALLGPDLETVDRARDALGIPSAEAAAFTQAVCNEALALLHQHRRQFGALVTALTRHQVLNHFEIADIWQTGAVRPRGRIGEIPRLRRRADLTDPGFRTDLRGRFGCTSSGKEA